MFLIINYVSEKRSTKSLGGEIGRISLQTGNVLELQTDGKANFDVHV